MIRTAVEAVVKRTLTLGRVGYYADFLIVPMVVSVLIYLGTLDATWLMAASTGAFAWTLIEYLIHRYILHREPFRYYHDQHHSRPSAYIGVPLMQTWTAYALLTPVLFGVLGENAGNGALVGVLFGYLSYIIAHDQIHHHRLAPGSWLYRAKLRHGMHHAGLEANFGVVFPLWDIVFGTFVRHPKER